MFEAGEEVICAPPNWQAHTEDTQLIILPPNSIDSIERITFTRLAKDSPHLNYNNLAFKLAGDSFDDFTIGNRDTLKQLIFQRNFGYERNVSLHDRGASYKGYCLVYVNDSFMYVYHIIASETRLKKYQGNLFSDVIGNLQIGKH